jgi:quercetin dioxygenase-like cupin family protein
MKTPYAALLGTFCVTTVLLISVTTVVLAGAQSAGRDPGTIRRALFGHNDQSGVPGKEIVTGTAELPAGTAIGWHVHAGDEAGYVLRGNLVLKTRGQPDRLLKAGDSFFNPRGAVHSMEAAPGSQGGTAYSTWVVDKDKPLVEMVP